MEYNYKEGAARPLYSSAPQNLPAEAPAPFRPLPGSAFLWGAAAVLSYPLAWYYTRNVLLGVMRGAAYTIFAVLFMLGVALFSRALGRKGSRETWFWGACWLAQSVALGVYGLHPDVLQLWQMLVWHLTAVYFVLCRTGMQAAGKANTLVAVDGLVGVFVLPWTGIFLRLRSLWAGAKACLKGRVRSRRRVGEVLVGVVLALVLAWYAATQLSAADAAFARLVEGLLHPLRWQWNEVELMYFVCSIPVGMWLFGLVGGGLCRKEPPLTEDLFYQSLGQLPRLPHITANLAVGALCAVYALFFGVQCAEFAAALGAPSPLEAVEASKFAVEGFWELCRVLVLDYQQISDISALAALPLEYLSLTGNRVEDLSPLAGCTGLQVLDLGENPVKDIRALSGLSSLRELCLDYTGISSLSPLSGLPLEKLKARSVWIKDYSPLESCPSLVSLITGELPSGAWESIARLSTLEELRVYSSSGLDLSLLEGMDRLRDLDVYGSGISNPQALILLPQLSMLNLGETGLSSLDFVPRLPALTGIDLREDPIGDFGVLLDCPYLKGLNISAWQLEQAERQLEGGELTISCG